MCGMNFTESWSKEGISHLVRNNHRSRQHPVTGLWKYVNSVCFILFAKLLKYWTKSDLHVLSSTFIISLYRPYFKLIFESNRNPDVDSPSSIQPKSELLARNKNRSNTQNAQCIDERTQKKNWYRQFVVCYISVFHVLVFIFYRSDLPQHINEDVAGFSKSAT
jgi:hypothetical protein